MSGKELKPEEAKSYAKEALDLKDGKKKFEVNSNSLYRCLDCVAKQIPEEVSEEDHLTIEDPRLGADVGVFSLKPTPIEKPGARVTPEEIIKCPTCSSTNVQLVR